MKNKCEISVFKGGRDYIQGADLIELAIQQLESFEKFVFVSRKPAHHPTTWVGESGVDKNTILATLDVVLMDDREERYVAVQDVNREITDRVEFDETNMFSEAVRDGEIVSCNITSQYSVWEYISSLQKMLLTQLFEHSSWWFVRVDGDVSVIDNPKTIEIKYEGKKRILYRSGIYLNGKKFGSVDFAKRDIS